MTADRDQSIERLLRQVRPEEPALPADDCPDAETLAALADNTLPAALRREVETHIADCYHCQALAAAIARAGAPVGAPADAAGDMPAWRRRALNWLVPAAAAATAVALWVLVPGQNTPPPTGPISERQTGEAPSPAVPPPSSEVVTSEPLQIPVDARADEQSKRDAAVEAGRAAAFAPFPAAPPAAAAPGEPSLKAESRVAGGLPPSPEASADRGQPSGPQPVVGGVAPAPEVSASAPLSANTAAGQGRAAGAQQRNEGALNESVAVQQEGALSRQVAPAARARAADAAAARLVPGFEVISPNARNRWRVGPGPIVQYSADGGATWATQQTGASTELTAGSSPAPEVIWLVGRGGVIVRTTDAGRQWQRVPFPVSADLTGITASTARNATVVLADGRQFATGDGGITWNPVR